MRAGKLESTMSFSCFLIKCRICILKIDQIMMLSWQQLGMRLKPELSFAF